MTRHRPSSGPWLTAIALLAIACGGADRSAAGVDAAPAVPPTQTDTDDAHLDHEPHETVDPGPELSPTEATLAALAAMDPDRLASLHDHQHHEGHANHDPGPREGRNSVDPERIVIPAIGVDADIGRAGIGADGEMEVPEDFADTSWFTPSVKPGRVGPSVITGHVDSRRGPAVFFDLKELEPGDEIEIHGDDGEVVVFAVTRVEQHAKDDYPRETVHGATDGPELRLITCGGIFDRSIGHYDDNIIVFAERL
ncbi:MAG: class F sortase [Nitriliruptoraceae bacterium]